MRGVHVVLLLGACGAEPLPTPAEPQPAIERPVLPSAAELDAAEARVLAPSPLELDAAVAKAGIADTLGTLVPERSYDMEVSDRGSVAVRTGVMLADTVFTGAASSTEDLVARARAVREGLAAMGATEVLLANIDGMIARAKSGTATRQDILAEVDGITSAMVPEAGWSPDDESGPLVQAGVWLESANLVATACLARQDTMAATGLLRDRELMAYFLRYVQVQGSRHPPSPVVDGLGATLREMASITADDQLDLADVRRIQDLTGSVLALL